MPQTTPLRFYYDNMLGSTAGTLSATSTSATATFSIDNIHNFLEVNRWQASSSATQNIDFDAGVGNTVQADYLCILGHNLNSAGASLAVQVSTSGAFAGEQTTVSTSTPNADTVHLVEFTNPSTAGFRYWRIPITGQTTAPSLAIVALGLKTTIAFIQPPFDPYADFTNANVSLTEGGFVSGLHVKSIERQIDINLPNSSTSVYNTVKTWHDTHGFKNFFMNWNSTVNPEDTFLVRPSVGFNNSINVDKFRNISFSLRGRREVAST